MNDRGKKAVNVRESVRLKLSKTRSLTATAFLPVSLLLIAIKYEIRITDYGLRITSYGLQITDYGLQITNYRLQITDYRLQIKA